MALPFLPGQVFDRKVGSVGSDSNSTQHLVVKLF